MIKLFIEGGALYMGLLTVELIALLLAAWKAPAWVKEVGLIALMTGLLSTMIGLHMIFVTVSDLDGVSQVLWSTGLHVALITTTYGMMIYVVSLIIRIVQKPRI